MSEPSPTPVRLVAGCMTGTSIDALDAAVVRVEGRGLEMRAKFVTGLSRSLGALGPRLRAVAEQKPHAAREIAALGRDFALLHGQALDDLAKQAGAPSLDLIAVHGQTVFHEPPLSWQLVKRAGHRAPHELSGGVGSRAADLAAGGQGAPITPLADWVLFRHAAESRAVVNLGGFCNITLLAAAPRDARERSEACGEGPQAVRGMDVCACNHLLDMVARTFLGSPFDDGGRHALRGRARPDALAALQELLSSQARPGRSLGTGDELAQWVVGSRAMSPAPTPEDLAATACQAIARAIAAAIGQSLPDVRRILLAGGGVHNAALTGAIAATSGAIVETTDARGVPATFREAAEMAVLGALCQDRVPITQPAVTGVRQPAPVSGVWVYP